MAWGPQAPDYDDDDFPVGRGPDQLTASARGRPGTWKYLAHWEGQRLQLKETLNWLPVDETHAAWVLTSERPWIHYVTPGEQWHYWSGMHHIPCPPQSISQVITIFTTRGLRLLTEVKCCLRNDAAIQLQKDGDESPSNKDVDKRTAEMWEEGWKQVEKYFSGLLKAPGHKALLYTLGNECAVPARKLADKHPRWLNCLNGTVDLETGERHDHDPADMLTYVVPVNYVPEAKCPMFGQLLLRVCGRDEDVAHYLWMALGYSLLGENPEQLIFFMNGPTKSGKSKVLEIVRRVLGDLAHNSQAELITYCRNGRNARVENSIRGKRFITITETSAFMHLDEGQVKRLTGEAEISVDQHYAKEEIMTKVTFTPWVATNEMPTLTNLDDAMRERTIVIPCGATIPPEQRDKRIVEKILAAEAEGILASLVAACVEYHRTGLKMPLAVQLETDKYAREQNTMANFLADTADMDGVTEIPMPETWERYLGWAKGEIHLTKTQFYEQLARQPGVVKIDNDGSKRVFRGFKWKTQGATYPWPPA